MAEHQITVGKKSWRLPPLFMVAATQNPIETRRAPTSAGGPARSLPAEAAWWITPAPPWSSPSSSSTPGDALPPPPLTLSQAASALGPHAVQAVQMQGRRLEHYLVQLVCATRPGSGLLPRAEPLVAVGASPRASIGIARAARARAWLAGRDFVLPEDIQQLAPRRAAPPPHPQLPGPGGQPGQRGADRPAAGCRSMPLSLRHRPVYGPGPPRPGSHDPRSADPATSFIPACWTLSPLTLDRPLAVRLPWRAIRASGPAFTRRARDALRRQPGLSFSRAAPLSGRRRGAPHRLAGHRPPRLPPHPPLREEQEQAHWLLLDLSPPCTSAPAPSSRPASAG